ncbi:acetoacetate--CoA ligase [Agrococcus baldri]|nr:acetoacetate--CoA ligase [Agrococcus baldri]
MGDATEAMTDAAPLWSPSAALLDSANMTRYREWVVTSRGLDLPDYDSLWRWSVQHDEAFWQSIWEYFPIIADRRPEQIRSGSTMPEVHWFPGARLNFAQNLLANDDEERIAIVHSSELRPTETLTYRQLRAEVAAMASALRDLGVTPGDRVAAYLPNIAEAVVAFLATSSVGAIWTSSAPEFGAQSVLDRLTQVEPKVLLVADGYRYGGRDYDRREAIDLIRAGLPTVEHVVCLSYLGAAYAPGMHDWAQLLRVHRGAELVFEQVPAEHPLWILYSSGTTGLPKAIVQSHGGILIEQLKSMHLHLDLHDGDRLFWFTTTGWMMWNMLVSALLTPASIVLYDGSPVAAGPVTCWRLAQDTGATVFGTSAGMLVASMKAGLEPGRDLDLSRLRAIGSTGSPLPPEGFEWVYSSVDPDVWLFSTSGGTDICTPLLGGCPTLPVYRGELQCRALGVAAEAWSPNGRPLIDEIGELVVTKPMPSMPISLWGDADGARYRSTYFDMFPGIWRHGDWVRITPRGGAEIYGRSDATINRQGVRMGTSEIYRAALSVEEVLDALVVDLLDSSGEAWMPLFVTLAEGSVLDERLERELRNRIRVRCSPRHVPDRIVEAPALPRTLSNKLLEIPVKRILMGENPAQVVNLGSLANPAALDFFVTMAASLRTAKH